MRIGSGVDAHRFGGMPPVILGGVVVDEERGLEATSDGDVAVHALIDALLGAAALGDLGSHFPSSDEAWHGASSLDLLREAVGLLAAAGFGVANADITIIAQDVRIAPHRAAMRDAMAEAMGVGVEVISVKATTTDGLGFAGRSEGIVATAVALIEPI